MHAKDAEAFASSWIEAWNAHDVDAVAATFADDVVFSSPLAATVTGAPDGVVRGRDALAAYWRAALASNPELAFELLGVYAGSDGLVIRYRNQAGREAVEALTFGPDGMITRGLACYGEALTV
jgi:hypothetical protein